MHSWRLHSLILLATGYVLLALAPARAEQASSRPPNILLILTDDQGWFDLGVHGNTTIETPVLDRLAGEGVRFSHFYAAPVCSPTRAGLMTGRQFQRTGAIDTYLGRDTMNSREITIAQVLKQAGYRTGLVGKWHLGRYMKYHPNSRGFDEYFGFWQYGFINHYFDSEELFRNKEPVATTGYITDVLTDAAIDFIRAKQAGPFFLEVAYNAPHDPHLAPDPLIEKYLKKGLPLREARVYGMISSLDQNIGRLLKAVDDGGLRGNTVVIFMTDNGGVSRYFKAGLRANKGTVYEGGIRVPFFVRWPGHFPAGRVVDAMAENVDVFPTLCEIVGTKVPSDRPMDGRSLLSLWQKGEGTTPHEYICRQWTRTRPNPDQNWAIRDRQYKLVNGELYDLRADPGESKNLAREHPDIVKRLRAEFERWFADVTAGQDYARVPIEVGRDDENPVELDVTWADAIGKKVAPMYRHYNRDAIVNWSEPGDSVRWKIDVVHEGTYEVILNYGCRDEDAGSRFQILSGQSALEGHVEASGGHDVFRPRTIGTMHLAAGPASLEIKPVQIVGQELMTLHKVWLRRLP